MIIYDKVIILYIQNLFKKKRLLNKSLYERHIYIILKNTIFTHYLSQFS